jgi:hypothetical protein
MHEFISRCLFMRGWADEQKPDHQLSEKTERVVHRHERHSTGSNARCLLYWLKMVADAGPKPSCSDVELA